MRQDVLAARLRRSAPCSADRRSLPELFERFAVLQRTMRSRGVNSESIAEMATATRANYRLGTLYALATAGLMAVQSPFSSLAAKSLSAPLFVCFTQIALLVSVPLLICRPDSRR